MALITVIVPVYKVEKYIHRCIDSILCQTFKDFELVLVDDGSPDKCGSICDEYARKDSRIHVIHQENGGLSSARNAGLDWVYGNSDSKWITFIDSDDWIHSDYLKILFTAATKDNVALSMCEFSRTSEAYPEENIITYNIKKWNAEDYFIFNNVNATVAWGKLYRRDILTNIRFPIGRLHEDGFVTHELLFWENEIAVIDNVLYYYYSNPKGIMNTVSDKKTIDAAEGGRIRCEFMKKNGYLKAYDFLLNNPFYLSVEIEAINIWGEDNKKRKKMLSRLRKTLLFNKTLYKLQFETHIWLYELAFPRIMRLYWLIKTMLKR